MSEDKSHKHKKGKLAQAIFALLGAAAFTAGGVATGIAVAQAGWLGGLAHRSGEAGAAPLADAAPPSYVTMDQSFTSNLKGSSSFVQASVAISTRGGEPAVEAIKANEPALRSVILQALAEQDYESISTTAGRRALLGRLRVALDDELRAKIGNGGINNVYFTAFVLQ